MKRHSLIQSLTGIAIALASVSSLAFMRQDAALLQFKESWVTASSKDVLIARCSRTIPFTEREMTDWLDTKANEDNRRVSIHVYGIELVDESPYLANLLQALLTQDKESRQPHRAFESHCKKAYCAAKELFGDRVGIQLLYMMGRFGFNGSHLRVEDSSAWTSQELDTLLLALSDLPNELIPSSPLEFNRRLTHYQRRQPNPDRSDSLASTAISGTRVYDSWNKYSVEMQRYALFHELGHIFGYESGLHASQDWYASSGWIVRSGNWVERNGEPAISKYAEGNAIEDFAESFAAYRYNPEKLKQVTPRAYDFMKTQVFKNVEYTQETACTPLYPEPQDVLSALDRVKQSILSHPASLSSFSLSDDEIDQAKQTCLAGPDLVSAFANGQLMNVSAQCAQGSEIKKAVATAADQSLDLKSLNSEWLSDKLYPQIAASMRTQAKCMQNCQNLARKGLGQIEHALELVLVGYTDLGNGQDRQPVQKFCADLSFASVQAVQGYPEIQELTGDHGTKDLVNATTKVCKVIQSKFRKRQSMSAEQISTALETIYPTASQR